MEGASSTFIQVVPEYRGYDDSDGTVPGLDGETLDTNNAIKAVESHYHVKPDHIDLLGTSMGGAVVLKLASERTDIHSVLAVSPFVGWDSMGEWAKNNLKNPAASKWYNDMTTVYGPFKPSTPKYQAVSIDYTKIHAPTLLLQGTADPTVPWQSVQFFYNELKQANKNAHLILVPGAGHGVHENAGQNDINQWYKEIGM
ncbi:alpha/beta hydrolase family protein [Alicyclobacillus suci]|uniref:alpha/beta hydrolase family protein n=1 Tax=Alicyclobacillus suci TaxID=2816080 RepID=UPI001A8D8720|nr:alpha/beta fold hydrolase [Alicyclobacillus suci]